MTIPEQKEYLERVWKTHLLFFFAIFTFAGLGLAVIAQNPVDFEQLIAKCRVKVEI